MRSIVRFLERLLSLQPGDLARGSLLFSYLFLIIGSYVVGKTARDALFLDRFAAIKLPYADIAIALLVGLVVAAYVRISRSVSLRNLLVGSLVLLASNAILFWWLGSYLQWEWTFPLFYVWVGVYGVLAPAQCWTLANYMLTTREARRLFGMIGGGAIAGWILGGLFTKFLVQSYGTESLLLAMGVALLVCAVVVVQIWARKPGAEARREEDEGQIQASFVKSLHLIATSSYLRAIAALICLASFVTTLAGWQFKALAKMFLPETDDLAAFFGNFNFYAGILCLVVQLLFTSRLLRRFGLGPALFVVPLALLFGSVAVLVWFSLAAAILLKGSDQVLRYSIDKPTVELLYLPVAANIKIQVKSFIDTVVWRMGDGLAGVTILLAAAPLGLHARPDRAAWLNLGLIGLWLLAAGVARRQYVVTLRESIVQHRLDSESATVPVLDRSATELLAGSLEAEDPDEILYALDLLRVGRTAAVHPGVRALLSHASPTVRRKAVSLLAEAKDRSAGEEVEALLRDPDIGVRTEALLYLAHQAHLDPLASIQELGDFPDFSIRSGMVAFLARPGPAQNLETADLILDGMLQEEGDEGARARQEAARLIAEIPELFADRVGDLLHDGDPEVARQAVRAAGHLRRRELLGDLLELLADDRLRDDACDALAAYGDRITGTLGDHLSDRAVSPEIRRRIPSVLVRIATPTAGTLLSRNLLVSDIELRSRVLSALNKLQKLHAELPLDTEMIETILAAEIFGHYRSYQLLLVLGVELSDEEPAIQALRTAMSQEVERIFRLLNLLFPRLALHSAYVGMRSTDPMVHDNALEFLDNILKPQIRNLLVPLLDGQVSDRQRAELADKVVGIKVESQEDAVAQLIGSPDPWLRSCGAFAVGQLGLKGLEGRLDECLNDPDPLLRETARQAKARLQAGG